MSTKEFLHDFNRAAVCSFPFPGTGKQGWTRRTSRDSRSAGNAHTRFWSLRCGCSWLSGTRSRKHAVSRAHICLARRGGGWLVVGDGHRWMRNLAFSIFPFHVPAQRSNCNFVTELSQLQLSCAQKLPVNLFRTHTLSFALCSTRARRHSLDYEVLNRVSQR